MDSNGEYKKISLKNIYKKVFDEEFCIDEIETINGEEWKPIDIDNRYFVSNYGRIKSRCGYKAKILKPYVMPNGYLRVDINGKGYFLHRLVYKAFTGEEPETIHHIDYKKQNNSISNLLGMTRKEHAKKT